MKLKDYNPNELLLTLDSIHNVSTDYGNKVLNKLKYENELELIIAIAVNIALNTIALIGSFNNLPVWVQIFSIIIICALVIYLIISIFRCKISHNKYKLLIVDSDLDKLLIQKAKATLRYTGIVRIVYKEKNKILYLTGADYFLPHSSLDPTKEISEQNTKLIQCLNNDFSIAEKNISKIKVIDDQVHFSIKPIHGTQQMNAFVFYDVFLKIQSKAKITQNNTKRFWLTIDEMKKKPEALSTNKDVIQMLEELPTIQDSFTNELGDIKVIWNITSVCPYNCTICATYDSSRKELDTTDKLKVLNHIATAKNVIKNIDFAGGDPLSYDESVTIIQTAIEQLGEDKISITTTGLGISKLTDTSFDHIVKHCEITIDASHKVLNANSEVALSTIISRDEDNYTENNIDQINTILDHAETMTINVPILNDDLSDSEIQQLIDRIVDIRNHHPKVDIDVTLLRLMPVGKMSNQIDKDTYNKYNPTIVASKIKMELENKDIKCKLHCSLRSLPYFKVEDASCNMLKNKLGIDCAGNVFACAWGGYLADIDSVENNPFYLGNLVKTPLIDIIEGKSKTSQYKNILAEFEANPNRKFCSVISYYEKKKPFENNDPLAKIKSE